ncbi:MAG: TIGR00725 family protein [Hormoscilla sp. GUM202]|nr:TIGR00725 family protein [Hormoscilla sp. GUM202]
MKKMIIGVMGPGTGAKAQDLENAYELGRLIAERGWVLLTGGRNVGVMDAASRGAKAANGLTIGILPTSDKTGISPAVDIPIITDLGNARNNINVLSSDVVVACGMGAGTASEIALALKSDKKVILLTDDREAKAFFSQLSPNHVMLSNSPEAAIGLISPGS